jgi:hypothetical protein
MLYSTFESNFVSVHAMKSYEGHELQLHSFLISALGAG